MSDYTAKMHEIRFRLGHLTRLGPVLLSARPRWSLTLLTHSLIPFDEAGWQFVLTSLCRWWRRWTSIRKKIR